MTTLDKSFEDQFSRIELIGKEGEGIEVIDLHPPHTASQTPIFVAPGWSETPAVYKHLLRELFEYRRVLLTIGHPRKGEAPQTETEHQIEELRKATNIIHALESKHIDKADFIAHSEGAINTTIAATISPEHYQSIVYVNPAGMIGESGFMQTVERFLENLTDDFLRAKRDHTVRDQYRVKQIEALKYIAANPLRAIRETMAISTAEIHHLLQELHFNGIRIGLIMADDDALFPPEKIAQFVKEDHIDDYRIMPGKHSELHYRPDAYSEAIMTMLKKITSK